VRKYLVPIVVEIIAACVMCVGIGVELATHANIGEVIMGIAGAIALVGGILVVKFPGVFRR
jgi:hypothetical protein